MKRKTAAHIHTIVPFSHTECVFYFIVLRIKSIWLIFKIFFFVSFILCAGKRVSVLVDNQYTASGQIVPFRFSVFFFMVYYTHKQVYIPYTAGIVASAESATAVTTSHINSMYLLLLPSKRSNGRNKRQERRTVFVLVAGSKHGVYKYVIEYFVCCIV